jgi:hypothetical protein
MFFMNSMNWVLDTFKRFDPTFTTHPGSVTAYTGKFSGT